MSFDLISDLNLDQWPVEEKINWKGLGTSLSCVVAGNISSNPKTVKEFLYELSDHYEHVMFVDGHIEHKKDYHKIEKTTRWFEKNINRKKNITYLDDSAAIVNGKAFIGSNGWWNYDSQNAIEKVNNMYNLCKEEKLDFKSAKQILDLSQEQSFFLAELVNNFSASNEIEEIIIISSAVPRRELLRNPTNVLSNTKSLNHNLHYALLSDYNNKVTTWCHAGTSNHDLIIDNVRYVSHPRLNSTYYPIRIAAKEEKTSS